MTAHTGLQRRNSVFYLRVRVPTDLVGVIGKREIVKSLGTRDPAEARRFVRRELNALEEWYQVLRHGAAAQPTTPSEAITPTLTRIAKLEWADICKLTVAFYHVFLELDSQMRRDPKFSRLRTNYDRSKHPDTLAYFRKGLQEGRVEGAAELAMWTAEQFGYAVDASTEGFNDLAQMFQRALLECHRLIHGRYTGEWSVDVQDLTLRTALAGFPIVTTEADTATTTSSNAPAPAPAPASPSGTDITLRQLVKRYIAAHPHWSRPTYNTYQIPLRAVQEIIGEDRPVGSILREDCRRVLEVLVSLPTNYTKRPETKGLSMRDAARVARENDLPCLTTKTVNAYMNNIASLFNWAENEHYILRSPARKLSAGKSAKSVRKPFTEAQLSTIFRAPLYTGCKDDRDGYAEPGAYRERRGRFWVPLLGLWGGLRLNEACQLDTADVIEADGVLGLHIRAEGPLNDKQLKTQAAHRFVPVHPELERLGFVAYVQKMRASGVVKLFPDLPKGSVGYYSDPFSKWFGRFLAKLGLGDPSLSHHSFRHTFRDALRVTKAPKDLVKALGGWAREGTDEEYGSGYPPELLFAEIAKIRYGALDLSHLHV